MLAVFNDTAWKTRFLHAPLSFILYWPKDSRGSKEHNTNNKRENGGGLYIIYIRWADNYNIEYIYVNLHKADNIATSLPMSFKFLLQSITSSSFMCTCFNYNQMYTDTLYTAHVYLKRKGAKSLKLWMPHENQNWASLIDNILKFIQLHVNNRGLKIYFHTALSW